MQLPPGLPDFALSIARHEAGHFVIARVLGFRVNSISIQLDPAYGYNAETSVTPCEKLSSLEKVTEYLRRRVRVLYAGALAETLSSRASRAIGYVAFEQLQRGNATRDYVKIRELAYTLRNIQHSDCDPADDAELTQQINDVENLLREETVELVDRHVVAIIDAGEYVACRIRPEERIVVSSQELAALPSLKALAGT